jgi:transcriptional regulator with XRE-family HTH domain
MAHDDKDVPEKKVQFGERLTLLMEAAKLSQTELARKAGIERSSFNRLVNNKREPRSDEIEWLAAALNVSVEELCRDVIFEGEPPPGDEREAQFAARVLAAETAREEAQSRAEALEKSLASTLGEVEKVRADGARREAQLLAKAERDKTDLEKAFMKREQELRGKLEQQLQRVQGELAKREIEWRTENWKLQQDVLTKDLELSTRKAQVKALGERARRLESALAGAKGAAVLSGLFGAVLGGITGAAMASEEE